MDERDSNDNLHETDKKTSNFYESGRWNSTSKGVGQVGKSFILRRIPGKQRMSLIDVYMLKRNGLKYFHEKAHHYRSGIYKFPLDCPSTIICEGKDILESCCDIDRVIKEPVLWGKKVNLSLINKYLPCAFTNDFIHSRRKAFIIGMVQLVYRYGLLSTLEEVLPVYMSRWKPKVKSENSLEKNVMELIAAVYSKSFLGITLNFADMETWINSVFSKTSRNQKAAIDAYNLMCRTVESCPRFEDMLIIGSKYKLKKSEIINEILFLILFNSVPATMYALISSIGRLDSLDSVTRDLLVAESEAKMIDGIEMKSLLALSHLENFILEVLRLSPPFPFIFGVARSTYPLFSSNATFQMNEGDALAGNIYESQRNDELFVEPNEFDSARFVDSSLKEAILTFGGRFNDESKSSNRKCAGQDIAMIILKACLLNLIHCDIKLKEKARFDDKNFHRYGRPDNEIFLAHFEYHKPCWWKLATNNLRCCYSQAINSKRSSVSYDVMQDEQADSIFCEAKSEQGSQFLHKCPIEHHMHGRRDYESSMSNVDIK